MSDNLFEGNINTDFSSLDTNSQIGDPLFVNEGLSDKNGYILQKEIPAIDTGKKFPEPEFPMGGSGIFKEITVYASKDGFDQNLDIRNEVPNIGASNLHNSDNALGTDFMTKEKNIFSLFPNPVLEDLQLKLETGIKNAELTVYDIQGRVFFEKNTFSS